GNARTAESGTPRESDGRQGDRAADRRTAHRGGVSGIARLGWPGAPPRRSRSAVARALGLDRAGWDLADPGTRRDGPGPRRRRRCRQYPGGWTLAAGPATTRRAPGDLARPSQRSRSWLDGRPHSHLTAR